MLMHPFFFSFLLSLGHRHPGNCDYEFKTGNFNSIASANQPLQQHRRPKLIIWTRTWLLLASGVVLQTVIYKGLYGINRFFLKEIKNVMFLNKFDVPYCLVVFFVVCPRLRPFWSVFGELALFYPARVDSRANGFVCLSTAGRCLPSPGLF